MEIPDNLKSLYKHWEKHSKFKSEGEIDKSDFSRELEDIFAVANERMQIWQKKESGEQPPYSDDSIFQQFRFCNIYRELDRQTIEIHKSLQPFHDNLELWLLNLAFNRFLCSPATYQQVGSLNFNEQDNKVVMKRLIELPNPKYGSAYVFPISVIQNSEWDTREKFFTLYLPRVIPKVAEVVRGLEDVGVAEALEKVLPVFGFNFKFHWTEILIDVAYQYPQHINLFKRFPIGPGSMPTMKMLSSEDPEITAVKLANLEVGNFNHLTFNGKPVALSAENWEGIGCEYRKYSNLKQGKGRRRLYRPSNNL